MKIAVIGAGAMGSLFGGLLAEAGEEVYLVDIWAEHVDAINRDGLRIITKDGEKKISVKATTKITEVNEPDLILVFVKSTFTEKAALDCLAVVGENTLVLTLQNGVGNIEKLATILGKEKVIAGTTAHGATMLGPGYIKQAGAGETHVGELDGQFTLRIQQVVDTFNRAGISTEATDNVMGLVWSKLMINVGINALTAITGMKNGELLDYPELTKLLTMAVEEGIKVANEKGIKLIFADPVEKVKEVARATAENKSSMLQDIERGRKTEIEVINGAIVREGLQLGLETPVNQTLTLLVQALEKRK